MFKVWEPPKEQEKASFIRLNESQNTLHLVCVDEKGRVLAGSYILSIHKTTGEITLLCGVSSEYGFKLDDKGRVALKLG